MCDMYVCISMHGRVYLHACIEICTCVYTNFGTCVREFVHGKQISKRTHQICVYAHMSVCKQYTYVVEMKDRYIFNIRFVYARICQCAMIYIRCTNEAYVHIWRESDMKRLILPTFLCMHSFREACTYLHHNFD